MNLGPLHPGAVCLSCGATPVCPDHVSGAAERGRDRAVRAFENLAAAQLGEALGEADLAVRRGMLRVIEVLDAVVAIERGRRL